MSKCSIWDLLQQARLLVPFLRAMGERVTRDRSVGAVFNRHLPGSYIVANS